MCFFYYTLTLSSFVWSLWRYRMFVRYILPSVYLTLFFFSQLSLCNIYICIYIIILSNSLVMLRYLYFILVSPSNQKCESLATVLGLGYETICCMSCSILIKTFKLIDEILWNIVPYWELMLFIQYMARNWPWSILPTWSAYPYPLVFLTWFPYSLLLLIW